LTQFGLYLDRAVHFLYPLIFYFVIGSYFFAFEANFAVFSITILLGLLTQQLIFFKEARLAIGETIKKQKHFRDLMLNTPLKPPRPKLIIRTLDYLTFMIYSLALFFYLFIMGLSIIEPFIAYKIYFIHILISLLVTVYKVFISYPEMGLYSKKEAERLIDSNVIK
ncbi:MAG: hypothetical protein ABIF06_02215, partial [bacterium]